MARRKTPEELSVEELRRLLVEKDAVLARNA